MAVQDITLDFKITAEVSGSQPIESGAISRELAQRFSRLGELFVRHIADLFNEMELIAHLEIIQFIHTLVTESHLKHSFP